MVEGPSEPSTSVVMLSDKDPADHIRKFFCSHRLPGAVSLVMTGPSARM